MQVVVQNNIVNAALKPGNQPLKVPCPCASSPPSPGCRESPRDSSGLGVRPEHVHRRAAGDRTGYRNANCWWPVVHMACLSASATAVG